MGMFLLSGFRCDGFVGMAQCDVQVVETSNGLPPAGWVTLHLADEDEMTFCPDCRGQCDEAARAKMGVPARDAEGKVGP